MIESHIHRYSLIWRIINDIELLLQPLCNNFPCLALKIESWAHSKICILTTENRSARIYVAPHPIDFTSFSFVNNLRPCVSQILKLSYRVKYFTFGEQYFGKSKRVLINQSTALRDKWKGRMIAYDSLIMLAL